QYARSPQHIHSFPTRRSSDLSRGEVMIDRKQVAQLRLVEFQRPQALSGQGGGLFSALPNDPPKPAQKTEVAGQHLESANVNPLRSEEHTSELQSRGHLVCRLL